MTTYLPSIRGRAGIAAILTLALIAPVARADLLVLDAAGGPGADFTDIDDAFASLQGGDTLLVRTGVYTTAASLVIDAQSIAVIADLGADVQIIAHSLNVVNLVAGQSVTLRGLEIHGTAFTFPFPSACFGTYYGTVGALNVTNVQGNVWIEDCTIVHDLITYPALSVKDATVTIHRSDIRATDNFGSFDGAPGLLARDSTVFAYDSTIDGGNGGHSGKSAQPTGPGAKLVDSVLFAQGCHFVGGDGMNGDDLGPGFCGWGAKGANALELGCKLSSPMASTAFLVDCTFAPGTGGANPDCAGGGTASSGQDIELYTGSTATTLGSTAWSFDTTSPHRPGEVATLTINGPPGDFLFLLHSVTQGAVFLPGKGLSIVVGQPFTFFPLVVMPLTGQLVLPVTIPPVGFSPVTVYVQAAFTGPSGLSSTGGTTLTIVEVSP